MKNKVWVQAAADVKSVQDLKEITAMSVRNGAEWIEIGHDAMMLYGVDIIRQIRAALGPDVKILADLRSEMAGAVAGEAAAAGADYITVEAAYIDPLIRLAIRECEKYGIIPVFVLNVRCDEYVSRAAQIASWGGKYFFTHRFAKGVIDGQETKINVVADMKAAVGEGCFVGVTSDDYDEMLSAIDEGADWIIFGRVLKDKDEEICRKWIDAIHTRRI